MVLAKDLLQYSIDHKTHISSFTRIILNLISKYLDNYGAETWNLRYVGIISLILFSIIRYLFPKHKDPYKIEWYGLIHSILTSIGSIICLYINEYDSKSLTGIKELYRSTEYCYMNNNTQSLTSLTSLHRILPALTYGFSILDFIDGVRLGPDFAIHGVTTFITMFYFIEMIQLPQYVTPYLILETSTVFLHLASLSYYVPTILSITIILLFALSFFICRIIIFPYVHLELMIAMYQTYNKTPEHYYACFHSISFLIICTTIGFIFNGLNIFWFYKILLKLQRKINGKESIRDKNELDHAHDQEYNIQTSSSSIENDTNDTTNNDNKVNSNGKKKD